jgi:hypothetical protein
MTTASLNDRQELGFLISELDEALERSHASLEVKAAAILALSAKSLQAFAEARGVPVLGVTRRLDERLVDQVFRFARGLH